MTRLIDADAYRRELLDSRDFEPFKLLDMQPTIEARPRFRHVILSHPRFGKCDACYDEKRMLFYTDPITAEMLIKYNWTWEEADNDKTN